MAEASLDLFGVPQKTHGCPPRTGENVPCHRCGQPHWLKRSQLAKPPKSGHWFCSRECQYAVSAKVTQTCSTCAATFIKFRSQANRGAKVFCSAKCRNDYGLHTIACSWPGCEHTAPCRRMIGTARDGATEYKVELVKRGQYTKYPFCPQHREMVDTYLGPKSRFTGGRSRMLADPEHEYDHRALSSRFTRMILFERADRRCESCATDLDWNAPFKTWEMDHRIPVFRGGKTKLSNLQILCADCHGVKSATEKSEVATLRWHSERVRGTRWMTHYEKDQLIAGLRQEIADLRAKISA